MIEPQSPEELAQALADCSAAGQDDSARRRDEQSIDGRTGRILRTCHISTVSMKRVLQYEPADLTISVEAGMRWTDLTDIACGQ